MAVQVLSQDEIDAIEIDEFIQTDFRPLTSPERDTLIESIANRGFVDPITLWKKRHGTLVVVDGHHRLQLRRTVFTSKKLSADVRTFRSKEHALQFAHNQQYGRRNLNSFETAYRIGREYIGMKRKPGPQIKRLQTAKYLEQKYRIAVRTVKNYGALVQGVDMIADRFGPKVKTKLLAGQYPRASMDLIWSIGRKTIPIEAFEHCLNDDKPRRRKSTTKTRKHIPSEIANELMEQIFAVLDSENLHGAMTDLARMIFPDIKDSVMREKAANEFDFPLPKRKPGEGRRDLPVEFVED